MENCGGGKPPPYDMRTRFVVILRATSESPLRIGFVAISRCAEGVEPYYLILSFISRSILRLASFLAATSRLS